MDALRFVMMRVRHALKRGRVAMIALLMVNVTPSLMGAPDGAGFRFAPVNDRSLGLWDGERQVLAYNYGLISRPDIKDAQKRSSYFHPIYGLDGEALTDDFPADHTYHRGLYWAWPHIRIGGEEVDLWSIRGIRIQFQKWLKQETKPDSATLAVRNGWFIGEREVVREEVRVTTHKATGEGRWLEIALKWTPRDRAVTLQGAEGKSYGGLNLRFAPRTKTVITAPQGRTPEDLLNTRLAWADLSGDFGGPGKMSGISVFPSASADSPPTWMTRHYGLLSIGWPGVAARTFRAGKPFTFRAALWIHRGNPEAAQIESARAEFLKRISPEKR